MTMSRVKGREQNSSAEQPAEESKTQAEIYACQCCVMYPAFPYAHCDKEAALQVPIIFTGRCGLEQFAAS